MALKGQGKARRPASLARVAFPALLLLLWILEGNRRSALQSLNHHLHTIGGPANLPGSPSTVADGLAGCTDFACLRRAHALPRGRKQRFNFPHFFIIGYPKCGTTSLHAYLAGHPQALGSEPKEPQFFTHTGKCWHPGNKTAAGDPWGCDAAEMHKYIRQTMKRDAAVASGLSLASFESTTDYSWGDPMGPGPIASGVRRELPWLKLVLSLREPISHEISGRVHSMEYITGPWKPRWFNPTPADECLIKLHDGNASMYECIKDPERWREKEGYLTAMATWLDAWPTNQMHIIQFENLTADASREAVLRDLMVFLDLDPTLGPEVLPQVNSRKGDVQPRGWDMRREEYETLISYARPLSERIAALLEEKRFYQRDQWLAAWRAAWQRNLDSCDAAGMCHVVLT